MIDHLKSGLITYSAMDELQGTYTPKLPPAAILARQEAESVAARFANINDDGAVAILAATMNALN